MEMAPVWCSLEHPFPAHLLGCLLQQGEHHHSQFLFGFFSLASSMLLLLLLYVSALPLFNLFSVSVCKCTHSF